MYKQVEQRETERHIALRNSCDYRKMINSNTKRSCLHKC